MSKNKRNDPSLAEDYIAQLNWRSRYSYRRPTWFMEPGWKYKILPAKPSKSFWSSFVVNIFLALLVISILGIILHSLLTLQAEWVIFALIIIVMDLTILFFAVRDAKRHTSRDQEERDQ